MEDTSLEEARYQFEVNLFGLARLTQRLLPAMRKHGAGRIINIGSVAGKVYMPLGSWYHASKHALKGWTDCLRVELKPFGIDVVLIEPGLIKTQFKGSMVDTMKAHSGQGDYEWIVEKVVNATQKHYDSADTTEPEQVSELLVKVVRASRPRPC